MNKFQLECLFDSDLERLKRDASEILRNRRRLRRLEKQEEVKIEKAEAIYLDNKSLIQHNSSGLFSLPGTFRNPACNGYFLPSVLEQDWSSVYPESGGPDNYYVYAHVDPTKPMFSASKKHGGFYGGRPFYIGKGKGKRAYNLKRNQGHGRILRSLAKEGFGTDQIVKIIFDGLTESKAYELEAKLIYFFGTVYDGGITVQGRKKWLVNLDIPKLPEFEGVMLGKAQVARLAKEHTAIGGDHA